jgi:uncharacterized circularly permuted ATP-grasp superfamily protein/uncharacterized alpha-E superfamily protein
MTADKRDFRNRPRKKSAQRYDELRDGAGRIRPAWMPVAEALTSLPAAEYQRRHEAAQAMLRDNGVTYNVYDEQEPRRWCLDILPFVISHKDWSGIEAGVIQRARLADALLADIYGPQRLIAEGHLPPQIVYGHPQFLRPLVGVKPPGGTYVHLYSLDLARMPDGSWTVLSSRADAVSGIGYALENRIVVGQAFSDLFAGMNIERLAAFFSAYRESVLALAEPLHGRPVLLTPGPHNEAYFEHAFLSHYLDLTLVEGDDLAVHDGRVYLKTLQGLERVSVIFRRVDSDYCDPVELKAESALGVPGLLQAVRAGNVVLANALGGSVVESPALDAYLHRAAQVLLGEELSIPDIPTVWCGTSWGRQEAHARLDHSIVRGAFDSRPLFSRRSTARLGREMSTEQRHAFEERLERRGATLVTQDIVPLGGAPVYAAGKIVTKPVMLRVFAARTADGYRVMPGGLARVADDETYRALSMQSGAFSKDVWVPATGPVSTFSLLRASGDAVPIQRSGNSPPSRTMDNLYWLGRYSERADNLARVLRTVVTRISGGGDAIGSEAWQSFLLDLVRDIAPARVPHGSDNPLMATIRALLGNRSLTGSLPQLLSRVRQAAWSARDRLSLDTWQTILHMSDVALFQVAEGDLDNTWALSKLDMLVRRGAAFAGYCAENMTRGPNWLFTDLGRRVERAQHLVWLTGKIAQDGALEESERVRTALEISASVMTYRSRYLNSFRLAPMLDLLLLDESNPRAIAYQLMVVEKALEDLARMTTGEQGDVAFTVASALRRIVQKIDVADSQLPDRAELKTYLERLEKGISDISDVVTDAYFSHAVRRRTGGGLPEI